MSGHWGHKGSWALCFQKLEKNKTTSSVGIIKSEFLKWLKEMSSYRKHCSHKEKLEEHQNADRGASTCSTWAGLQMLQGIKCGESWHQSKGSCLSPSHIIEVSPSTGKSSPTLCHWPAPQLIHSCAGTCTQREMISLTMVGASVSCEFDPWNGSHRQSPSWWKNRLDEGPWSSYTGSGSYWSGMLGCDGIPGINNNTGPFQLWQLVLHNL